MKMLQTISNRTNSHQYLGGNEYQEHRVACWARADGSEDVEELLGDWEFAAVTRSIQNIC